jgi:hypothetical protein
MKFRKKIPVEYTGPFRALGESERRFFSGGKTSSLLEGSQAVPARPSDNGKRKVKT